MRKLLFIFFLITISKSFADNKNEIINHFEKIDNLNFKFEQNINGRIETGNCTIQYPKKIYCKYNGGSNKILVSNSKSVVVKTNTGYYRYPIKQTPLNLILDKEFMLKKINNMEEKIIDNKFINYKFIENDNEINIFFDLKTFHLRGWQTTDIYQNLNITYLWSIKTNQILNKDLFKLPLQY